MKGKNKKKIATAGAGLALLAVLSGTFAWQSYTEWVTNHMQTRGYEEGRVTIIEDFEDDKLIDENPTIKKTVNVVNTSSADAFVRISFEEMLDKLASGAVTGTGFASEAAAGFPVIFNKAQYNSWTDNTAKMNVYEVKDGALATDTPTTLKLYAQGNSAVLVNEIPMTAADFPENFDFEKNGAKMPVISGSFAAGDAVVAQKVTGFVELQPDGTYNIYKSGQAENLAYWGYGVDLTGPTEFDWAGASVNVAGPAAPSSITASNQSGIANSNITFTQANVTATAPTVGTAPAADWYFNSTDGYFYYTGVLVSGSTTNSSVIEEINFPTVVADPTYNIASYDLYVGLESIPATVSAVTATSNFGALIGDTGTEGNKTWVSNGSGWGLTDPNLIAYYESIATVTE